MKSIKSMKTFEQFKEEVLRDPELKRLYDESEPEFQAMEKLIEKRLARGMTQAQLAKKLKTKQSAISRFESGHSHTSLQFLHRVAGALGARLKITIS